jgi:hypothetical protein
VDVMLLAACSLAPWLLFGSMRTAYVGRKVILYMGTASTAAILYLRYHPVTTCGDMVVLGTVLILNCIWSRRRLLIVSITNCIWQLHQTRFYILHGR